MKGCADKTCGKYVASGQQRSTRRPRGSLRALNKHCTKERRVLRDNLDENGGGDLDFEAAAGSGVMIVADLKLCKGFFGAAV